MYLDFFGLREQPFGVTPDPAFLYLSATHADALESLRSDLIMDRGFMALVGEPGLGKTTVLNKLLDEWRDRSRVAFLFQTQCESRELFRYLLGEVGVAAESMGLAEMHHKLNHILFQEMIAGKRFILVIDEAQNLDESVLETVRLLSNFETQHAKLLNIVLAGQPQLEDKLATPGLRQLRQRIGLLNQLRALTPTETARYISHRLGLAGQSGDPIFTLGAVHAIAQASQGIPRNINNLCHQALYAAAIKGVRTINLEMAQNAIAKYEGRSKIESEKIELAASPAPPVIFTEPAPAPPAAPAPMPAPVFSKPNRPAPPFAAQLGYATLKKANAKRWGSAAIATCVLLLAGAAYITPPVRHFAWQQYRSFMLNIQNSDQK